MKTLIIYYSRRGENYVNGHIENLDRGNTEIVVSFMADITGADIFHVETVKEYPGDYHDTTIQAQTEMKNHERPKLKKYLTDVSAYDNIIIAGPCWWGTYPMPIFSELDKLDLSGKNVYPVMTHEGSGMGNSVEDLRKKFPSAHVYEGLAIYGSKAKESQASVERYVKKAMLRE